MIDIIMSNRTNHNKTEDIITSNRTNHNKTEDLFGTVGEKLLGS